MSALTEPTAGAPPDVLVIGAMKCGTSALHRYLDLHPDIAMSDAKELNFFFDGGLGRWHRGWDWYVSQFDRDAAVRGESSPGYTSPDHPEAARRIAEHLPEARLLYLVRDPLERALSQYRHHVRDGTEQRPVGEALLDPDSQYIARSRYLERLAPFLRHVGRERILVVVNEDLDAQRRATLERVYAFVGVDPSFWSPQLEARVHEGTGPDPDLDPATAGAFRAAVRDDVERLRAFLDDDLAAWSV